MDQVMATLNHDRVVTIFGRRLNDQTIADIIETGADEQELLEALNRLTRGDIVGAETMRPASLVVSTVCQLLRDSTEINEDPERC